MPRVLGFADWPTVQPGESFQAKVARSTKLSNYLRLFHCSIVPFKLENSRSNWASDEELKDLTEKSGSIFGKMRTIVINGDVLKEFPIILSEKLEHNSVIFDSKDETELCKILLEAGWKPKIVTDSADIKSPQFEKEILLMRSTMTNLIRLALEIGHRHVYLLEILPSYELSLLISAYANFFPFTHLRTPTSLIKQAADLALYLGALPVVSPTPTNDNPAARQIPSFLGSLDMLGDSSIYTVDESDRHFRIPSTGAMLFPSINVPLLLAVCSYLPRSASNDLDLKISTIPTRRVDKDGKILDKDRHYFMTRIVLPHSLVEKGLFKKEELKVRGPLAASRFVALSSAAFEAMKRLYHQRVVDDHFIPVAELLEEANRRDTEIFEAINGEETFGTFNEEEISAIYGEALDGSTDIKEIVPDDIKAEHWIDLGKALTKSEEVTVKLYLYVFEYRTVLKDVIEGAKDLPAITMPFDAFIHLTDTNYFASQHRSIAILLPNPLCGMRKTNICLGQHFNIEGSLCTANIVTLTVKQVKMIVEFQAFLYGILNNRNSPEGESKNDIEMLIPEDKKTLYLVAFVGKAGATKIKPVFDLNDAAFKYQQFLTLKKDAAMAIKPVDIEGDWELDWDLMNACIDLHAYQPLDSLHDQLVAYDGELPEAPSYDNGPDKPPIKLDFEYFALRRLIIFAPHNGLFYRIKSWHADLSPSSPFEYKSYPECQNYADYLRLRYGITIPDPTKSGLAETKRLENYADINLWVTKTPKLKSGNRRKSENKSFTIPSAAQVVPIPYALIRMAMLLPRVIFDMERQLVARQLFHDQLSALQKYWPPPQLMVEALTGLTAVAGYDYERMEILGDSVLKLFVTLDVFLYSAEHASGEGKLTRIRQDRICNYNLCVQAIQLDLPLYARLVPFIGKLFAPPELGILIEDLNDLSSRWPSAADFFDEGRYRWQNVNELDERAGRRHALYHLSPDGSLTFAGKHAQDPTQRRHKNGATELTVVTRFGHTIPPKSLADMVEALIASFYLGPKGLDGALECLIQMGLVSLNMRDHKDMEWDALGIAGSLGISEGRVSRIVTSHDANPLFPLPTVPSETEFPFEELEGLLDYKFKNRRLLFIACTHRSVDLTHCYERLEWLGDAALDWIVTCYYWSNFNDVAFMTPARITMARQTAVCNEAFARVVVRWGIQRYLRIAAPSLQIDIDAFVQHAIENEDISIPAPKVLGDLFEAIAGAVFIDCHFDVKVIEEKFLPLLQFFLDTHADPYAIVAHPLQEFWHDVRVARIAARVEFTFEEHHDNGVKCMIRLGGRIIGEGYGVNRVFARVAAAKMAVSFMRGPGWCDLVN